MNEDLVLVLKECIKDVALYAMPIAAFLLSVLAIIRSSKVRKIEEKLNQYELSLKEYELEKIEIEKRHKPEAKVEARIVQMSKDNYIIKVWNSGDAIAFNVDYSIPKEYSIILNKQVVPFEELQPGNNFEEHVIIHMQSAPKYKVITEWEDSNGNKYTYETIRTW